MKLKTAILLLLTLAWVGCVAISPQGWKTVNAGQFTFQAPADFRRIPSRGVDSLVGEFKGNGIELRFDYGPYSNDLSGDSTDLFEKTVINGRAATIITPRPKPDTRFPYSIGVSFRDVHPPASGWRTHLMVLASGQTLADRRIAEEIFRSIRFIPQR